MIDVTIVATHRPELLERTLASFFKNLWSIKDGSLRAVINVDPVGSDTDKYFDVLDVCLKYFADVKINRSEKGNFPAACKWIWENATADYIFNLEEDWELLYAIPWYSMLRVMDLDPKLAHLRFSIFRSTQLTCKNWRYFYNWNGLYFQCRDEDKGSVGWCGHPSLNRKEFMREALPLIDFKNNPEKQIKGRGEMRSVIDKWNFGSYIQPNNSANIRDIGRQWMINNGYIKKGKNKEWFTEWEKI